MSKLFLASPLKLLLKCALPNTIGSILLSAYFIVDGIFVGKYLGATSLGALGIAMPFVMMSFALSDMVAVGCSVQVAMKLGKGKLKEANLLFSTSLAITFIIGFCVSLAFFLLTPVILQGINEGVEFKNNIREFIQVFAFFMPFLSLYTILDNLLRICGKNLYSMSLNVVIAVLNIVLDYVFIVLFKLGLSSAALATCLGFSLATLLGFAPFLLKKTQLRFSGVWFRFKSIANIFYNGSSEFFNNISGSLYASFANLILLKFGGTNAVAAFSIVAYIDSFIIMLLTSLNEAMQGALSFNFARKDRTRLKNLLKSTFKATFLLSLLAFLLCLIFTKELTGFFVQKSDEILHDLSVFALSLYALNYLVTWFNLCVNSTLTAFNEAKSSLLLSLIQNLFAPLFLIYALSFVWGLSGVFITAFIAEIFCVFLALFFLKKILKRISIF